jgi:DNA mismatch repair protein MutL
VAVIGDGAMTAGMAYEALNHAGGMDPEPNLLVILNDNRMSISEAVGGVTKMLGRMSGSKTLNAIREGGKKMIRVTDNGCGIEKSQISKAFERHATSKIQDDSDLTRLVSLGFRGEALSSIAAVSQVEMITKTRDSLTGIRATNQVLTGFSENAPVKLDLEEIGAPDGTSVVVRNLFYNVPVRLKFLKQPQTEAGYITDLIERQALSHPGISFHYRVDGKEKLHTTGNGDLRELLYRIYGREISKKVLPLTAQEGAYKLEGFVGRPDIS